MVSEYVQGKGVCVNVQDGGNGVVVDDVVSVFIFNSIELPKPSRPWFFSVEVVLLFDHLEISRNLPSMRKAISLSPGVIHSGEPWKLIENEFADESYLLLVRLQDL